MVNKNENLKFFSTDTSVSFLRPFSKYENLYMLYLQYELKTVSMVNIKTLKDRENLLKAAMK